MSDDIELSKIAEAAGTDSDTARALVRQAGTLPIRKENGRYVIAVNEAILILDLLRQNGKMRSELLLLVLIDRDRWREKHDLLETALEQSRGRIHLFEQKVDVLNAEVKEEARKRAEAAEKGAERSDKTANNAIAAINRPERPLVLAGVVPAQPPPGIPARDEHGGWKLPPSLGEFTVPRAVLPFVLLFLGFGLGWWLKSREANAEIRARIESTKEIQEGTRALADIAKNQADQVKKDHEDAANRLKEANDAKLANAAELTSARTDYDNAQGALKQIEKERGKDKDRIKQLEESLKSLNSVLTGLTAENARLEKVLESQRILVESQNNLVETKNAQLKDHEVTISSFQKRFEEMSRKGAGEKAIPTK